jgi:glycosyltransferase involved in cell wall biosynthesis
MSSPEKEIDILVPVYNRASWIGPFIDLIKAQTYKNVKVYFACGESQDNTDEEIQKVIKDNPDLPIFYYQAGSSSVGKLRNYWLDSGKLQGDYIAFLDIDDSFKPTLLQAMVDKAEKDQADLIQCAFARTDCKTKKVISLDMAHNPTTPIVNPMDYTNIVFLHTGVPAKLFRRSVIGDDVRFGDSHRFEDVAFVAKFLAKAKVVSFINDPLYDYIISTESVSAFADKAAVEKELSDARKILLDLKTYYIKINPKAAQDGFVDSLAFLRYGIGLTTRACLSKFVKRHQVIKESEEFLNTNFPLWKTSRYLAKKNTKHFGKKTVFVQWCKHLYRIHWFSLFVLNYSVYTKVFKKDIKP